MIAILEMRCFCSVDILVQLILGGGLLEPCRMFSSTPGLHLLNASSIPNLFPKPRLETSSSVPEGGGQESCLWEPLVYVHL